MSATRVLHMRHVEQGLNRSVLAHSTMQREKNDIRVRDFRKPLETCDERSPGCRCQRIERGRLCSYCTRRKPMLFVGANHSIRWVECDHIVTARAKRKNDPDSRRQ